MLLVEVVGVSETGQVLLVEVVGVSDEDKVILKGVDPFSIDAAGKFEIEMVFPNEEVETELNLFVVNVNKSVFTVEAFVDTISD